MALSKPPLSFPSIWLLYSRCQISLPFLICIFKLTSKCFHHQHLCTTALMSINYQLLLSFPLYISAPILDHSVLLWLSRPCLGSSSSVISLAGLRVWRTNPGSVFDYDPAEDNIQSRSLHMISGWLPSCKSSRKTSLLGDTEVQF